MLIVVRSPETPGQMGSIGAFRDQIRGAGNGARTRDLNFGKFARASASVRSGSILSSKTAHGFGIFPLLDSGFHLRLVLGLVLARLREGVNQEPEGVNRSGFDDSLSGGSNPPSALLPHPGQVDRIMSSKAAAVGRLKCFL